MLVVFLFIGLYKKFADPYSLSVIFFLLVHFMVPHKEPRFLFPIVGVLPVILGYGLRDFLNWRTNRKTRTAFMMGLEAVVLISILLNGILLVLLLSVPVAQHIAFSKKINDYFSDEPVKVVFYQRTPYETPTVQNVATYYLHSKKPNIAAITVENRSELLEKIENHEKGTYFVSTYDRLVKDQLVDEMDCTSLAVSSRLLARINRWVQKEYDLVLPELWALYECRGTSEK
jgi:hypothetical protein